jgi:hypothetical protein
VSAQRHHASLAARRGYRDLTLAAPSLVLTLVVVSVPVVVVPVLVLSAAVLSVTVVVVPVPVVVVPMVDSVASWPGVFGECRLGWPEQEQSARNGGSQYTSNHGFNPLLS